MNTIKVNVEVLANFFNVDKRSIVNWVKYGMPKESRGVYDLAKCFKWYRDTYLEENQKRSNPIRIRYWKAKAESEEMKLTKLKESLISRKEVETAFKQRARDLKKSLEKFSYKISEKIEGKEQIEIMDILGKETDNLLRCFCNNMSFVYEE